MPPFALKIVFDTNTTCLYIPFVFVLLLHFWVSESFPSNTYRWASYVLVPYIPSSCKKYDEEVWNIYLPVFFLLWFSYTRIKRWWWTQVRYRKITGLTFSRVTYPDFGSSSKCRGMKYAFARFVDLRKNELIYFHSWYCLDNLMSQNINVSLRLVIV